MKSDVASNYLKDKIKIFKTISKDTKGLNGQEFIIQMDFIRETFAYFLLDAIPDESKREEFGQKVTTAVNNRARRLQFDHVKLR